jgi:hypothetical protein
MQKRGQISIFIIIGMVILVTTGLIFFARSNTTKTEKQVAEIVDIKSDMKILRDYVDICFENAVEGAVWKIGRNGGYLFASGSGLYHDPGAATAFSYNGQELPVYVNKDNLYYPDKKMMEELISYSTFIDFKKCVDQFSFEKELGIRLIKPEVSIDDLDLFNKGSISIDTQITVDHVSVKMTYPLEAKQLHGGSSTKLSQYTHASTVRLGYLHTYAAELASLIVESWRNGDNFNISTYDLEVIDPLDFSSIDIVEIPGIDTYIITLKDYSTFYLNAYQKTYEYVFAIRNDMEGIEE